MAQDIRNLADEEVMQLVQRGDPRAFELLYDRHGGAAYSLAYRIAGRQAAAEDVVQEALLSIWRNRLRYDQTRGSVRTWILGIVHNRAIDGLRRSSVHDRRRATLEVVEERFEARERTDVEVARREEARSVRGALETLPDEQRRTHRAGVLRRLHAHADRGDAARAGRDGEGQDEARTREDETAARGGRGMTEHERASGRRGRLPAGRAERPGARRRSSATCASCDECRDEFERLRPAAEALPGSVEQLAPPPGLKARLMAEVDPRPRRVPRAPLAVAAAAVIALAVAFGVVPARRRRDAHRHRHRGQGHAAGGRPARHPGRPRHAPPARHAGPRPRRACTRCGSSTATGWSRRAPSRWGPAARATCAFPTSGTPTACSSRGRPAAARRCRAKTRL